MFIVISSSNTKSCNSAYRLRYWNLVMLFITSSYSSCNSTYRLWYWNSKSHSKKSSWVIVATALTGYGIETCWRKHIRLLHHQVATALTIYGIETLRCRLVVMHQNYGLQQCLPFTVCAEGCGAAEERRDNKVRTSQVPERSEGKTKVIWQWCLPFTVLKLSSVQHCYWHELTSYNSTYRLRYWNIYTYSLWSKIANTVATAPTVYGIETRNHRF